MSGSVSRVLRRAAIYRVCSAALGDPVGGRLRTVADLADATVRSADPRVRPHLEALAAAARATDEATAAAEYASLFHGTARCATCEGAYGPPNMAGKTALLADISGFYAAFGLEPAPGHRECEDHVTTELEFMSVLAVKEGWAIAEAHGERAEIAHDAAVTFLTDHLGRWAAAFTAALEAASALPYYQALAALLAAWIAMDASGLGVTLSPTTAPAATDPPDAEPFSCPMATD
jgi:TorA maturation chaperone TorD